MTIIEWTIFAVSIACFVSSLAWCIWAGKRLDRATIKLARSHAVLQDAEAARDEQDRILVENTRVLEKTAALVKGRHLHIVRKEGA